MAQRLINDGFLLVNEYETLDLNIPVPYYSRLLNKDGILRIGDQILVPKADFIMIINDGDLEKIKKARSYKIGDYTEPGISTAKVFRKLNPSIIENTSGGARTDAWVGSCDNIVGSYRLIVYNAYTGIIWTDGAYPCPNVYADYYVRLRSLKKILGTWQNHKTSQWSLKSNLKADHYGKCGNSPWYFVKNIVTFTNYYPYLGYDHTWNAVFFTNVHVGPCESGGADSCPDTGSIYDNPNGLIDFPIEQHYATGKEGTTCYIGQ